MKPTEPRFMPKIGFPCEMKRWIVWSMKPSPPSATITSASAGGFDG